MTTLKDLYIEELQDLWSANDQMSGVVSAMCRWTHPIPDASRSVAKRKRAG